MDQRLFARIPGQAISEDESGESSEPREPVYLDNAATTRLAPQALAAMLPFLASACGNPSSAHCLGRQAAAALAAARRAVIDALGLGPQVYFTSGGTESANLAIRGVLGGRPGEVVSTSIEHPCVLETLKDLAASGTRVVLVSPRGDGSVDPALLASHVSPRTDLVVAMHVNNETGAILPVDEIAARAKTRNPGVLVFADGVQAFGKLAAPKLVDLYSVSAHKVHGPKGVGALAVRPGVRLRPEVAGGGQEGGLRSGTENVPGIVGFGAAVGALGPAPLALWSSLRSALAEGSRRLGGIPNSPVGGLPSILNVSYLGAPAATVLRLLDERGVCVSAGSACAARYGHGSLVLKAMGLGPDRCGTAIRYSFGRNTTGEDVSRALEALADVLPRARGRA